MLPVLTLPSELQALFVGLLSDATIGRLAQTSRAGRQLVQQRLLSSSFVTWRRRLTGKPFGTAVLLDALHRSDCTTRAFGSRRRVGACRSPLEAPG